MSDPIKFIFIVTGDAKDFPEKASERTMDLCRRFYKKRLDPAAVLPAPAVLRFVHFQCLSNTILVFDFPLNKTTRPRPPTDMKRKWKALKDFAGTGDPSFTPSTFVDAEGLVEDNEGQKNLTILNVFHSIRGAPPNSVLELSIFSHAWEEGPILQAHLNSTDDNPPGPKRRNDKDTDGRARTDFEDNMGEDPGVDTPDNKFPRRGGKNALKEFKEKLDSNATFIFFGCNGQDSVRDKDNKKIATLKSSAGQVINQAYILTIQAYESRKKNAAAKIGKVLASGKVPDDLDVPIDMGFEFDDERRDIDHDGHYTKFVPDKAQDKVERQKKHYSLDQNFFPAPDSTILSFTKKWPCILGFIARSTQKTYAFKAASQLGIDVLSGPVGTKSSVVTKSQMKVCGKYRISQCTRTVNFHEMFMRTKKSVKSELRYFVYDADTVTFINQLAQKNCPG